MDAPGVIEAKRIGVLTAHFRDLQGLALVAFGILLVTLSTASLLGLIREGDLTWFVLSIPVLAVGATLARHHYRKHYGDVRPRKRPVSVTLAWIMTWTIWFLSLYAVSYSYTRLGSAWIPVSLEGFAVAGALALAGRPWRLRPHWLLLAMLVAVVALMPLGLLTAGPHPLSLADYWHRAVLMLVLGVSVVIGGLGDHRLLTRSLGSRRRTGTG